MSISYHLRELEFALDQGDEHRTIPGVLDTDREILDIGCGIGQTLVALHTGAHRVGVDVDMEAIRYGSEHFPDLRLLVAKGDSIPFPDEVFDLVYSRVSLPYMNIPRVVREVRRVLRPGGRFWMTMHTREHVRQFMAARRSVRASLYYGYVVLNGYLFKHVGVLVPLGHRYESWQDEPTMCRLLTRHGFTARLLDIGGRTAIEATKPGQLCGSTSSSSSAEGSLPLR